MFNKYLTSIGQTLASNLSCTPPFILPEIPDIPIFIFLKITSVFVQKQLYYSCKTCLKNKSVCLDRLLGRLFRAAAPIISEIWAYNLNLFFE